MPIIHFGPSRLTLNSWNDLVAAAQEGLLDEHTYCELKKGLPPSGNNTETARDLASFGVMGGVFIVGVKDAGGGKAGEVVGVSDPYAVKARLVALADAVVQPSLACEVHVVESSESSGTGCVVVEISPSPSAPHRADDRYWGRGSEGKRVLADPEVAQLFTRRRDSDDDFVGRLMELEQELDPVEGDASPNGRFFFLAEPARACPRVADWAGRGHPQPGGGRRSPARVARMARLVRAHLSHSTPAWDRCPDLRARPGRGPVVGRCALRLRHPAHGGRGRRPPVVRDTPGVVPGRERHHPGAHVGAL